MAKASKKASSSIISLVQAIDSSKSKLISYDEAWEVISEYTGIEGGIYNSIKTNKTVFTLSIKSDDEDIEIGKIEFDSKDVFLDGDWDWTVIFKTVIEYMIKNKLVKKPRTKKDGSKSDGKYVLKRSKTAQISKISAELTKSLPKEEKAVKSQDIQELRKKRFKLSCKISNWKKKGKDITQLEKEYNELRQIIKNM
jgi:hypothetical protein